jgi:hypothetical protein
MPLVEAMRLPLGPLRRRGLRKKSTCDGPGKTQTLPGRTRAVVSSRGRKALRDTARRAGVVWRGELTVLDGLVFSTRLASAGRHAAYGFGTLPLRPAVRTVMLAGRLGL